ncbi:MAG: hypothetical protein ACFCUE_06365 [Candidatus Bathyarchaeia archaeon]
MLKVKCASCHSRFNVDPEIFGNYEIVFCPTCGLDHQIVKQKRQATVKTLQLA